MKLKEIKDKLRAADGWYEKAKVEQEVISEWRRLYYICGCLRTEEAWCPKHKGGLGE